MEILLDYLVTIMGIMQIMETMVQEEEDASRTSKQQLKLLPQELLTKLDKIVSM